MTDSAERKAHPRADLRVGETEWRVYEAWRAPSGLGLAYFLPADGGPGDRRASLDADRALSSLGPEELTELWSEAAELTPTERRVLDGHGEVWLVQAVGPAWAEGGRAADAVGMRARCVSADREVHERGGRTPRDFSDEELLAFLGTERDESD